MRKGRIGPADFLLGLAVFGLPWWLGGVETAAHRTAGFVIALAWCAHLFTGGTLAAAWKGRRGLFVAIGLLAGWAALQLVPLPPAALRALSPNAAEHHGRLGDPGTEAALERVEALALARVTGPDGSVAPPGSGAPAAAGPSVDSGGGWHPISLQPGATLERLTWFLALWAAFALVCARAADPSRRRVYIRALIVFCGALAFAGLIQRSIGGDRMFFLWERPRGSHPFGPYINPVHFVGALVLLLPVVAGFTVSAFRTLGRGPRPLGRRSVGLAVILVSLAAVLFAGARSGGVLVAIGILAMVWRGVRRPAYRVAGVLGTAVLAFATMPWWRGTRLAARWSDAMQTEFGSLAGRTAGWSGGLDGIADYWLTGSGFGSFREVFPAYVLRGEFGRWLQLHNDYLELAFEGGLIAIVLVAGVTIAYLRDAWPSVRAAAAERRETVVGLGLGCALLAIHAIWDFNHQIPANALLWVVACGILVSAGGRRERS